MGTTSPDWPFPLRASVQDSSGTHDPVRSVLFSVVVPRKIQAVRSKPLGRVVRKDGVGWASPAGCLPGPQDVCIYLVTSAE